MDVLKTTVRRLWDALGANLLDAFLVMARRTLTPSQDDIPQLRPELFGPRESSLLMARIDPMLLRCAWLASWIMPSEDPKERNFFSASPSGVVRAKLANRLVETHLHINSTMTSEIAWCYTISDEKADLPEATDFVAKNLPEGGGRISDLINKKGLNPWLWWARVTRLLLRDFQMEGVLDPATFLNWSEKKLDQTLHLGRGFLPKRFADVAEGWKEALAGKAGKWYALCYPRKHDGGVKEPDNEEPDYGTLKALVELLRRARPVLSGMRLQGDESPTIEQLLCEERRWLVKAFAGEWQRLTAATSTAKGLPARAHSVPTEWHQALLQYIRVRNLYHRYLTLYERNAQFDDFYNVFRRGSRVAKRLLSSDDSALKTIFRYLDSSKLIARVEFRHPTRVDDVSGGPVTTYRPYQPEDVERMLLSLEKFEEGSPRRGGFIFHFNKKIEVGQNGELLLESTHRRVKKPWRLGREFAALLEEACALSKLWSLKYMPHWIVGFDVANFEYLQPNWLYLAVLRKIRIATASPETQGPRPSFTFHAGECFRLTLSGLHRVAEVVDFLGEGNISGRIGHALALNPDVGSKVWSDELTNEDWAMAVCWAYTVLQGAGASLSWIEGQANQAVREIRDVVRKSLAKSAKDTAQTDIDDVSRLGIEGLAEVYRNFGRPHALVKIGFPFEDPSTRQDLDELHRLTQILLSNDGYKDWARDKAMRLDAENPVLSSLREALGKQAEHLARCRNIHITLEACPTSNLAIGIPGVDWKARSGGYGLHPAMGMYCNGRVRPPWRVSLSTDNPLVFRTDLVSEYERMYMAAKDLSSTPEQALASGSPDDLLDSWCEHARQSSFVRERRATHSDEREASYDDVRGSLKSARRDPRIRAKIAVQNVAEWWNLDPPI